MVTSRTNEPPSDLVRRLKVARGLLSTQLDRRVSIKVLIWSFPLAFLLHDFEEIFTMETVVRETRESIPPFLRDLVEIKTPQLVLGVAIEFMLITLSSFLASRAQRQMHLFTLLLAAFYVHAFGHLAQTLLLRRYTSGVITALLVVLPFSRYVSRRLSQAEIISQSDWNQSKLTGSLILGPFLIGLRQLGKIIFR
jgi:Protein of unknown function with HXXEE motif